MADGGGREGGGSSECLPMDDLVVAMQRNSQALAEALAADRARREAADRIQRESWEAALKEKDAEVGRLRAESADVKKKLQADTSSKMRWEAAYELLLGANQKLAELRDADMADSRTCAEIPNSKEVESFTKLGQNTMDHTASDFGKLKQAYETLSSKKDKEVSALLSEKDSLRSQLDITQQDYAELLKNKKVEAAQATKAALNLQQSVDELKVLVQKKDDEIGRLRAEAVGAKKKVHQIHSLVKEKDDEIPRLKGWHPESVQKQYKDIIEIHKQSRSGDPAVTLRHKLKTGEEDYISKTKTVEKDGQEETTQKRMHASSMSNDNEKSGSDLDDNEQIGSNEDGDKQSRSHENGDKQSRSHKDGDKKSRTGDVDGQRSNEDEHKQSGSDDETTNNQSQNPPRNPKRKRDSCNTETANDKSHKKTNGVKMVQRSLLSPDIESKHRASRLEQDPASIEPLITRTPRSNWMIHPDWIQRLKWAGLLPFARLVEATHAEIVEGERRGSNSTRMLVDHSLLTCLVDRWRPETHTFHFRWGEMAPTLHDVSFLLGLPLAGEPIGPLQAPAGWEQEMALRFQNILEGAGPFASEAHGPKFDWLLNFQIQKFGYPEAQMTVPQITRSLEAYIMWLLGKVMFTENHVTTISARYIPIAVEIANATCADEITQRSWGSAVLAATYRGMCNACQLVAPKSAILGCPLLLQLWSWERFPIGRPDIEVDQPFGVHELVCTERVDLPTFATLWTRRPRRFRHDQVRNCYPLFNEQFDVLHADLVIWEPYTPAVIEARYPGGISVLCTRDHLYWLTKAKIIFDVCAEEISQQRVMRQFGLCQQVDPPPPDSPLPPVIHKFTRKGSSKNAAQWRQRVQSYITEWEAADTRYWPAEPLFDLELFNRYLQRYMPSTRLRIIQHSHPKIVSEPASWELYPTQTTFGSRQHAAQLTRELQNDFAEWGRSLSTGPLLGRPEHMTWFRRMEDKFRGIYAAITCTRTSNAVHHQPAHCPPLPSTHQLERRRQDPRLLRLDPPLHRHDPRPRLSQSPLQPSTHHAVGSSSQHQTSYEAWEQQQQGGGLRWES